MAGSHNLKKALFNKIFFTVTIGLRYMSNENKQIYITERIDKETGREDCHR
jgi:hypothetical protein